MEFTIELARKFSKLCKKDRKFAEEIATQLVNSEEVEPANVARFLLRDKRVVTKLLTEHVMKDVVTVVSALTVDRTSTARTRKAHGRAFSIDSKPASKPASPVSKRTRLTARDVESLKKSVVAKLAKKPAARKDLQSLFHSIGAYNRIMRELVDEKRVAIKGKRRLAVYVLSSHGAKKGA
jgi:hypothetical protein